MTMAEQAAASVSSRRVWRIGLGLLTLLLAIVAWLIIFLDGTPPDDAGMIPQWSTQATDSNPLAVFCADIKKTSVEEVFKIPESTRYLHKGSEAEVQAFLDSQSIAFTIFDRLMATDPATWQWPGGIQVTDIMAPQDYLEKVREMSFAMRMKVQQLSRQGHHEEALQHCLSLVAFGHRLHGSKGTIIHQMVASNTFTFALSLIEEVIANGAFTEGQLQQIQIHLEPLTGCSPTDYAFALRGEYLSLKRSLPEARQKGWGVMYDGSTPLPGILGRMVKPNHTMRIDLALVRPVVAALTRSWREAQIANEQLSRDIQRLQSQIHKPRFYLDGNYGGKVLVIQTHTMTQSFLSRVLVTNAQHQEVFTMLALRRFELQYGRLPATLDELVPAYLPTAPIDPFSNAPLRWIVASKTLYSVGSNLTDDGGTIDPGKRHRGDDAGSLYWWSPEAIKGRAEREEQLQEKNTSSPGKRKTRSS
jgi:hypothetical protein